MYLHIYKIYILERLHMAFAKVGAYEHTVEEKIV